MRQRLVEERAMPEPGVALNALFSLRKGTTEEAFLSACGAFYRHLQDAGYARGFRCLKRLPLPGFGLRLPDFDYQIIIEFADAQTEAACYGYLQANQEPVRSLHAAMNSKVAEGAQFYLTAST
jgi:uncharacterized protein DUF6614